MTTKSRNILLAAITVVLLTIIGVVIYVTTRPEAPVEAEPYTPSAECAPAYEAMREALDTGLQLAEDFQHHTGIFALLGPLENQAETDEQGDNPSESATEATDASAEATPAASEPTTETADTETTEADDAPATMLPTTPIAEIQRIAHRTLPAPTTSYSLERTVKMMNAIDAAQLEAGSFTDFLEYMAKQDFRGVAPEVLQSKLALFPILDKLNALRKEKQELESLWSCLRTGVEVASDDWLETTSTKKIINLLPVPGNVGQISKGLDVAFETFKRQQAMNSDVAAQVDEVRRQYIAYMEAYAPVYYKYMEEWDLLCLNKDRAYISLYAGKLTDALNSAGAVLEQDPTNREGLLLKALALVRLGQSQQAPAVTAEDADFNRRWVESTSMTYNAQTLANPCYFTAQRLLDQYMTLYPDKSAPALLLSGMLQEQIGDLKRATTYYEQAAIEYPRQAEALTDLLDSYRRRTYLTQSVEGNYLLNYYRSTMVGAGIFSPNLRKAALNARCGDMAASREEIYKHFFRRGSQALHDCLLSDMQYCEEHLFSSFKPMMLEQSYIDLAYEPAAKFLGMGSKKSVLEVTLTNRSDYRLENVRIFLCIHTVGMYKDDYAVLPIREACGLVAPHAKVTFDEVDIAPIQHGEIAHVRAIIMTDDKICWVDSRDRKQHIATSGLRHGLTPESGPQLEQKRQRFMQELSLTPQLIIKSLRDHTKVTYEAGKWYSSAKLHIALPGTIALLSPCYTINPVERGKEVIYPVEDSMARDEVEVTFDRFPDTEMIEFYIYSEIISFRMKLFRDEQGFRLFDVQEI